MSDKHEPKKTGDPIMDKFLSNFDTPERAMARAEAMDAAAAQFNSGAPIPPVKASDLKQLWEATRRMNADMPPRPGVAVGLAVYAAYGFEAACAPPEELMAITSRGQLLSAIVERGVLNEYVHGEELDEEVFRAAATMPCDKDDFFQAIMPDMVTQLPAEDVAKFKEEMRTHGYDIYQPSVDRKFLEWLRNR
jgi:hypothetical protein